MQREEKKRLDCVILSLSAWLWASLFFSLSLSPFLSVSLSPSLGLSLSHLPLSSSIVSA